MNGDQAKSMLKRGAAVQLGTAFVQCKSSSAYSLSKSFI
jgi:nitronate monooxygenase